VVVPIRERRYSFVTLKKPMQFVYFCREKFFERDLQDDLPLLEDFQAALKLLRVKN
jgi:hypothetical protein